MTIVLPKKIKSITITIGNRLRNQLCNRNRVQNNLLSIFEPNSSYGKFFSIRGFLDLFESKLLYEYKIR